MNAEPSSATPERGDLDVEEVFRSVSGHAVATLIRWCGDISLAEDAVQDAFVVAMQRWPSDGVPPNPAAWIVTTARRRGIDQLRRSSRGRELEAQAQRPEGRSDRQQDDVMDEEADNSPIPDDRLRLMFTCCHPSIRVEHQVALTLRLLGGLDVSAIASNFLVSESAMARRLGRAKFKIAAAKIPYRVPTEQELPQRLGAVLAVLYLIYNAGTSEIEDGRRLRLEAIRLTRTVVELMPQEQESRGLLALLLLNESRVSARSGADGSVVLLRDQDRGKWNGAMIQQGLQMVRDCIAEARPGPFQLQAAIQAVHCHARSFADTDWSQIVELYDHLLAITPSPVIAMNRAIAVGETDGPTASLQALQRLQPELEGYAYWHAAVGAALRGLGQNERAAATFQAACRLASSERDRRFFAAEAERLAANQ